MVRAWDNCYGQPQQLGPVVPGHTGTRFIQCLQLNNIQYTYTRGGSRICEKGGGGAAATASAAGAKVFGGSRLKTLFGISKGGRAPPAPPPLNPLVYTYIIIATPLI